MTLQERINKCPNNKVPLIKGDRVDYIWPQYVEQYIEQLGYTKAVKTQAPDEVKDAKPGRKPKAIESDEQQ
jgi:hypothetical protein